MQYRPPRAIKGNGKEAKGERMSSVVLGITNKPDYFQVTWESSERENLVGSLVPRIHHALLIDLFFPPSALMPLP
jgi:hypothetical protein